MRTVKYGLAFLLGAAIPCALWVFVSSAYAVTFGVVEVTPTITTTTTTLVPENNKGWFIQNQGADNAMIGIGRSSASSQSEGIVLKPDEWIAEQNYNGTQQHAVKATAASSTTKLRVVYYQ